jgi:hypothetical protein
VPEMEAATCGQAGIEQRQSARIPVLQREVRKN